MRKIVGECVFVIQENLNSILVKSSNNNTRQKEHSAGDEIDPIIHSQQSVSKTKPRKPRKCYICGKEGHNRQTCKSNRANRKRNNGWM